MLCWAIQGAGEQDECEMPGLRMSLIEEAYNKMDVVKMRMLC